MFWNFWTIKIPMQVTIKDILPDKSTFIEVEIVTEIFMNQIKHVIGAKQEFEYSKHVNSNRIFWKCWTIKFLMQASK